MRSGNLPTLSVADDFKGYGELVRGDLRVPLPRLNVNYAPFEDGRVLSFEAVVSRDHRREINHILSGSGFPSVEGWCFEGRIRIPKLYWRRFEGEDHLTGEAAEVHLNWEPLPTTPSEQHVTLALSATNLAVPERDMLIHSYTGEIDSSLGSIENAPVVWPTALGEMRLVRHFRFRTAKIGVNAATVRIPIPVLVLSLAPTQITADVAKLSDEVRALALPAVRLISYLSRCHVHILDVEIASEYTTAGSTDIHSYRWIRAGPTSSRRAGVEMLPNPYRMGATGMATLLARLTESQYRDVALAAMEYLPSASQARHVESQLLFGFTALETLVNGIHQVDGTERTLGSAQFAKIARRVRKSLDEDPSLAYLGDEARSQVMDKIPELNRPPIASQAAAAIERVGAPFTDLFAPNQDLRDGLKRMYRARNAFLHSGRIESLGRLALAATRATALAERIVGALIGLDREWIDSRGEGHLRHLAAEEAVHDGTI